MDGLCRELMAALLSSGEATDVDYEPAAGERNGGRHGKRMVTLFGELPPVRRTYYHDTGKKEGRYPFDDRLGLCGRYTPALCAEAMRYAVNHPCGDASREFARAHPFALSPDVIREIVDAHGAKAVTFARDRDVGGKEDMDAPADIVYAPADGTGIALRKRHASKTRGGKGGKGRAKTREVKMAVFFKGGVDSGGKPFRLSGTTTYVATTDRRAKFEKQARAESDRRFGRKPRLMIYIGDGGRWVHTVHDNVFPFAVEILDIFHAIEHLRPLTLGLGIGEGTKRWKRLHRQLRDRISAGQDRGRPGLRMERQARQADKGRHEGIQVLQAQQGQDEVRRIQGKRLVLRIRHGGKRLQDGRRAKVQAVGHDLVAERLEVPARAPRTLQAKPTRRVLQPPGRGTAAGGLCGVGVHKNLFAPACVGAVRCVILLRQL